MSTNREKIKAFLTENCQDRRLISGLMRDLEPFFVVADAGQYPLKSKNELDPKRVAKAITQATRTNVKKVIFVSLANLLPKPDWMTDQVYDKIFENSLSNDLWIIFENIFGSALSDTDNSFDDIFGEIFWPSILNGLEKHITESIIWRRFEDSIKESLYHYIGLSLLNCRIETKKLRPLIRLLPSAVPLGEKADEPGTWIVLVA